MRMRFLAGLLLIALPYSTARDAAPPPSAEPQLWWDAPCGARQGSRFDVEVPGKTLAGAMAAWFDCSELRATIRKVEEVTPEPPPGAPARKERTEEGPAPRSTGLLDVEVDRAAVIGFHIFRLAMARGTQSSRSSPRLMGAPRRPVCADPTKERRNDVPPHVVAPGWKLGAYQEYLRGAFLGAACDPMAAPDPYPEGFQVEELSLLKTLAPKRLEDRRSFLELVDRLSQPGRDGRIPELSERLATGLKFLGGGATCFRGNTA